MVDFQSRDTRRGFETTDEADEPDGKTKPESDRSERDEGSSATADESRRPPEDGGIALVTVATDGTDVASVGDAVAETLEVAGYDVVARERLGPKHGRVQQVVDSLLDQRDTDAVLTVGGTGVTVADVTVGAVEPLFEKSLPGFGELLRLFAHDELGTRIVHMRTAGGIADGTPVFCLPAHESTARLAVEKILASELDVLIEALR